MLGVPNMFKSTSRRSGKSNRPHSEDYASSMRLVSFAKLAPPGSPVVMPRRGKSLSGENFQAVSSSNLTKMKRKSIGVTQGKSFGGNLFEHCLTERRASLTATTKADITQRTQSLQNKNDIEWASRQVGKNNKILSYGVPTWDKKKDLAEQTAAKVPNNNWTARASKGNFGHKGCTSEQKAAMALGYTQISWDNLSSHEPQPPSSSKKWAQLTDAEQAAARMLGYDMTSWNNESGTEIQPASAMNFWAQLTSCDDDVVTDASSDFEMAATTTADTTVSTTSDFGSTTSDFGSSQPDTRPSPLESDVTMARGLRGLARTGANAANVTLREDLSNLRSDSQEALGDRSGPVIGGEGSDWCRLTALLRRSTDRSKHTSGLESITKQLQRDIESEIARRRYKLSSGTLSSRAPPPPPPSAKHDENSKNDDEIATADEVTNVLTRSLAHVSKWHCHSLADKRAVFLCALREAIELCEDAFVKEQQALFEADRSSRGRSGAVASQISLGNQQSEREPELLEDVEAEMENASASVRNRWFKWRHKRVPLERSRGRRSFFANTKRVDVLPRLPSPPQGVLTQKQLVTRIDNLFKKCSEYRPALPAELFMWLQFGMRCKWGCAPLRRAVEDIEMFPKNESGLAKAVHHLRATAAANRLLQATGPCTRFDTPNERLLRRWHQHAQSNAMSIQDLPRTCLHYDPGWRSNPYIASLPAEQLDTILTDVRRNFPTGPPSSDDMASRLLNKKRYYPPALQERLVELLAATSAVNLRSMNGYTQGMDGVMAYFLTLGASDELAFHLFQQLVHNNRYCMAKVWGRALPFVHTTLRFLWSKHPKAGKLAGKIATFTPAVARALQQWQAKAGLPANQLPNPVAMLVTTALPSIFTTFLSGEALQDVFSRLFENGFLELVRTIMAVLAVMQSNVAKEVKRARPNMKNLTRRFPTKEDNGDSHAGSGEYSVDWNAIVPNRNNPTGSGYFFPEQLPNALSSLKSTRLRWQEFLLPVEVFKSRPSARRRKK